MIACDTRLFIFTWSITAKNLICNVLGYFKGLRKKQWQQNEFAEITQELILFPLNSAKLFHVLFALHLTHLLKSSAKWSGIAGQSLQMSNWSDTAANNTVPSIYTVPATPKDAKLSTHPVQGVKVIQTGWSPTCQCPRHWLWSRAADRFSPKPAWNFPLRQKGNLSDLSRYKRAAHV